MSSMVRGTPRCTSVRNWPSVSVGMGVTSIPDSGVDKTAKSGAWVRLAKCAASAPSAVTELTSTSPVNSRAMQVIISSSME
jgi:hypothetical protein